MIPISLYHESLPSSFQSTLFSSSSTAIRFRATTRCCSCKAILRGDGNDISPWSLFQSHFDDTFSSTSSIKMKSVASRRSFLSLTTIGAGLTSPLSVAINLSNDASMLGWRQLHQPSPVMLPSVSFITSLPANAAETIGKDESCNDASCLGAWDGLLADCPHKKRSDLFLGNWGAGCVSSQDDTPGIFAEPWDYSENIPLASSITSESSVGTIPDDETVYKNQMDQLILTLESISRQHGDDLKILNQEGRYIRVLFTDGSSGEKSIGEFYFTPQDTTVQFRLGSSTQGISANVFGRSLSNMERSERLRKALRYLKVPVLRNRKQRLFFVESDLDGFGPGGAALGPPEEMSPGELIGR